MRTTGIRGMRVLLALCATAPLLFAADPASRRMEIVSGPGHQASVKIYSGESVVFRIREVREGIDGIFQAGDWLRGVTLTLRNWAKVDQGDAWVVKGGNRSIVREVKPDTSRWGDPPSSIRIDAGPPGRYRLEATKPGWESDSILVHLASLELVDIDGRLTEKHYGAAFDVRLIDPDEEGKPIPLRVESLDGAGRLVDLREDIVLGMVVGRADEYRSNHKIRLSSAAVEGFRDRLARAGRESVPSDFFDMQPMRIAEGGSVRVSFRSLHALYPLPLGQ